MTNKTVDFLITGAGGQLGREFCDYFSESQISYKAFESAELDITDRDAIELALNNFKPKVLLNCAAYTKVDQAEDDKVLCYKINDIAVQHLANACAGTGTLLVHFSTDYVFSGLSSDQKRFPEGYPPDENGNPTGIYATTKWEGEQRLLQSGCQYLIIRVAWLCGKNGQNFVKTMLRLGREKEFLNVVDDQIGSPSFTKQVVEQTMALIDKQAIGIFHISSDGLISWYEFAAEIMKTAGLPCEVKPIPTSQYPTRARRPAFSKLDTSLTASITGIPMGDWKMQLNELIKSLNTNNATN
jgi:dTDP-4-dehydrorhamnose reductase